MLERVSVPRGNFCLRKRALTAGSSAAAGVTGAIRGSCLIRGHSVGAPGGISKGGWISEGFWWETVILNPHSYCTNSNGQGSVSAQYQDVIVYMNAGIKTGSSL